MLSNIVEQSRKIVIKVGSNTLSNEDGKINRVFMKSLARQIDFLIKKGKQVIIVSSGARIAGVSTLGKWQRKEDIHYKQALCAIGQVELMRSYRESLEEYDLHIAQMLLTRDDFHDNNRTLNIRNTLFTLVDEGVIPIINENDTTSVEEIKIGDNDTLAALTTNLWNADLLILLSDIDGIFDKNPKEFKNAVLLKKVKYTDNLLENIEIGTAGSFGTGGIVTKIEAAKRVTEYGIPMILANGKKEDILQKLLDRTETGTLFLPAEE